jgi:hypothetical protein
VSKDDQDSRVHDKGKEFLKVGWHLQQVHKDCPEGDELWGEYPRKELDRTLLGNFVHHNKVLQENKGKLKVVRWPPPNVKGNLYDS